MEIIEAKIQVLKLIGAMHRLGATTNDFKEILDSIMQTQPFVIHGFTVFDVISETSKINESEEFDAPLDIDDNEAKLILGNLQHVLGASNRESGLLAINNEIYRYCQYFQGRGEAYQFQTPQSPY